MSRGRKKVSIYERLENFKLIVDKCWRFTGKIESNGYGRIDFGGKQIGVHRLSAHLFLGFNLNSDKLVLHKNECKYKDCWNPEHLYIGSQVDNINDTVKAHKHANSIKEFCPRGHSYVGVIPRARGNRDCKICASERYREGRQLNKEVNKQQL